MTVKAFAVPVPEDGSTVEIAADQDATGAKRWLVRNTGTVIVVVGGSDGNCVFPLGPGTNGLGETYGTDVDPGDALVAHVQTDGTAGELTVIQS